MPSGFGVSVVTTVQRSYARSYSG